MLFINEDKMNELVLANRAANWRRLKALVLDSVHAQNDGIKLRVAV